MYVYYINSHLKMTIKNTKKIVKTPFILQYSKCDKNTTNRNNIDIPKVFQFFFNKYSAILAPFI